MAKQRRGKIERGAAAAAARCKESKIMGENVGNAGKKAPGMKVHFAKRLARRIK